MRKTLALLFSLFGLFDSAYLWWVYTSPTHPLVCLGSGCDEVRASRFAFWAGIPTPAFGAVLYAVLVLLLMAEPFVVPKMSAVLRRVAFYVSAAGLIVSLYLTSLEAFQIHAWCAWCVAQQIAIAIIFVLLGLELGKPAADEPKRWQYNTAVLVTALVVAIPAFAWLSHHSAAEVKQQLEGSGAEGPPDLTRLIRPDSHTIGPADAPVTIVEFGDFQCPSCIIAEATNREIRRHYPKQVRFVFREFPLAKFHVFAERAAEAAECASDQGKFWEMHDRMYEADGELAPVQLKYYAQELGLDTAKFNACLDSGEKAARIQDDVSDGKAAGVGATPTFWVNQQKHIGALKLQDIATAANAGPSPTTQVAPSPAASSSEATRTQPAAATPSIQKDQAIEARGPIGTTPVFHRDHNPTDPNPKPTGITPRIDRNSGPIDPNPKPTMSGPTSSALLPGATPANGNPLAVGQTDDGNCDPNASRGPQKNEIPTTAAKDLHKQGAVFVDIRSPKDFAKSHIPGAVNLPLNKISDGAATLPKDKPVVVYESGLAAGDVCAASRAAAGLLASRGYKNVMVYHDGFAGWQKSGGAVQ